MSRIMTSVRSVFASMFRTPLNIRGTVMFRYVNIIMTFVAVRNVASTAAVAQSSRTADAAKLNDSMNMVHFKSDSFMVRCPPFEFTTMTFVTEVMKSRVVTFRQRLIMFTRNVGSENRSVYLFTMRKFMRMNFANVRSQL